MSTQYETCSICVIVTKKNGFWERGKFIFTVTKDDGTELHRSVEVENLDAETEPVYQKLVQKLLADGWTYLGKLRETWELTHPDEPKIQILRRPVSRPNITPMQALHLLHEGGYIADDEFTKIARRIDR